MYTTTTSGRRSSRKNVPSDDSPATMPAESTGRRTEKKRILAPTTGPHRSRSLGVTPCRSAILHAPKTNANNKATECSLLNCRSLYTCYFAGIAAHDGLVSTRHLRLPHCPANTQKQSRDSFNLVTTAVPDIHNRSNMGYWPGQGRRDRDFFQPTTFFSADTRG